MVGNTKIIAISNTLNSIDTTEFGRIYDNLFWGLLSQFYSKGEIVNEIVINKRDLVNLTNYTLRSNKAFRDNLNELWDKISTIKVLDPEKRKAGINQFISRNLFTDFEAHWSDDLVDMTLVVTLNPKARDLFMEKVGGWMKMEYFEYREINSAYSRALYRFCCERANLGIAYITVDDLMDRLSLPQSYRLTKNMYSRVLNPFKKECSQYFENLKIISEKTKDRTSKVWRYKITFKPRFVGSFIEGRFEEEVTFEQIRHASLRQYELNEKYEHLTPKEKHELVELNDWLFRHEKPFETPTTDEEIKKAQAKLEVFSRQGYQSLLPAEKEEFKALADWFETQDNPFGFFDDPFGE